MGEEDKQANNLDSEARTVQCDGLRGFLTTQEEAPGGLWEELPEDPPKSGGGVFDCREPGCSSLDASVPIHE